MTVEEKIKLGMYGNHCKVIEDMMIETAKREGERISIDATKTLHSFGVSDDKIAEALNLKIERVNEILGEEVSDSIIQEAMIP